MDRRTGNLVLVDSRNRTRWQSLDHPTDKLVRGEQRRLPLHFVVPTTKVVSPSAFYSFELDGDKIAAYVNLGKSNPYCSSLRQRSIGVSVNAAIWTFKVDVSFLLEAICSTLTFCLLLNPLNRFPGPFAARLTDFWMAFHVGGRLNQYRKLELLHK